MTGRDIEKSICREMSGDLEQGMLAVGRYLGPACLPTRDWCVLTARWVLVMLRLRGSAMKKSAGSRIAKASMPKCWESYCFLGHRGALSPTLLEMSCFYFN